MDYVVSSKCYTCIVDKIVKREREGGRKGVSIIQRKI